MSKKTKDIVVGYGRVSSEEQASSGLSLVHQKEQCEKWTKEKGCEFIYFEDAGKTGSNLDRKGIKELEKFLKTNNVKCIILWKLDRITRNIEDFYGKIIPMLRKCNTTIASIVERFDDVFEIEPMILAVHLGISAQELKNIKLRTSAVLKHRAESGYVLGKAPIGYKNIKDAHKHGIIVPDPGKSHYIKRAFELYATNMFSYDRLGRELAKFGFVDSQGRPFLKKRIGDILNNPVYMGKVVHHGEIFDGVHTPIITPELFYRVQLINKETNKLRTHTEEFTYSNYIRCAQCGCNMVAILKHGANNSGDYVYYHCSNYKKFHKKEKNIRQEVIDEALQEVIESFDITDKELNHIKDQIFNAVDDLQKYENKTIDNLNKEYKKVTNAITLLLKGKDSDGSDLELDTDTRREIMKKLQAEKNEISSKITYLNENSKDTVNRMSILLDFANRLHELYLKATPTEKRLILTTITDEITYNEATDTISVKLKPAFEYLRQLKLQNKASFTASVDELYGTLESRSASARQAFKNEQSNLNQIKVYGTLKRLVNTKKEPTHRGSKKFNVDGGT